MASYVQGVDYYFMSISEGEALEAFLLSHNYNFADFGGFVVDTGFYAGYYFDPTQIDDDEAALLEQFSADGVLKMQAIFDSVQAHYFGI